MIQTLECRKEHLEKIDLDDGEDRDYLLCEENLKGLFKSKKAYTILDSQNNEVLFCGGIIELSAHRAHLWSVFAKGAGRVMLLIHRRTKRFLDLYAYSRIEAVVRHDFERGHRWIEMLGFQLEAECMRKFYPDGSDASFYARVL